MNEDRQAWNIKFFAILTAAPRAVGAMLAAEGLHIPTELMGWWLVFSALAGIGLAVDEGFAFAYMLRAWRKMSGKPASWMISLAIFSAAMFVVVMAPYLGASVRGQSLSEFIPNDIVLLLWSASVALSTISVVMGVGYAQKAGSQNETDPAVAELRSKLKDSEQGRRAAEDRAKQAEEHAKVSEERFAAAGELFRRIFAAEKRERILALHEQWPKLGVSALATMAESSPGYVSDVLKSVEVEESVG